MSAISNIGRRLMPRQLQCALKFAWIFLRKRAHCKLDANYFTVDAQGDPRPWMTYPCIDYLETLDFTEASVLEIGGGASTLWWSNRAKSLCTIEEDSKWIDTLRSRLEHSNHHANLIHCPDKEQLGSITQELNSSADIIVVDGINREAGVSAAIKNLAPQGMIIVDNSDWLDKPCRELRVAGFIQIDFAGFGPLTAFPWVSSVFLSRDCKWARQRKDICPSVLGGK